MGGTLFGILVDHGYDLQFISDMDPVERENLTKALLDDLDDVQLIKSVDHLYFEFNDRSGNHATV